MHNPPIKNYMKSDAGFDNYPWYTKAILLAVEFSTNCFKFFNENLRRYSCKFIQMLTQQLLKGCQ